MVILWVITLKHCSCFPVVQKRIDAIKYNNEFWNDNPIIKRTFVEQKVLDDFVKMGYFGAFEL